ncbi:MAG: hypothetical protein H6617_02755 [Bdellovibrionaceae bacterium]|nr:hypothetical protein [Bdellovibrionales bacterium]MCB9253582.1 hypothetical protein [Pseudobdellovibrionaceae bacterium]
MKEYKEIIEQAAIEEEKRRKAEESLIAKLKAGHKKPVTRRDFIAHGLAAGGTFMMLPSLLDIVGSNRAYGAEEPVPVLVIDIAGGASIASFFPAQGQGAFEADGFIPGQADLIPAHDKMGPVATIANSALDLRFGAPVRKADPGYNPFINNANADSTDALRGVSAITACGITRDDTSENPFGVQSLIARLNSLFGCKLPILSTGDGNTTPSGGRSMPLLGVSAEHRALRVPSLNTVAQVLNVGTPLVNASNEPQRRALLKALVDLSSAQIKQAHGQHFLDTLKGLASSGFRAAQDIANANLSIDPRGDATYQRIFGIDGATAVNDPSVLRAATLKAAFDGLCSAVVFQRNEGDYHDKTLDGFVPVHQDVGRWTGQAIRLAHALNRKLVIFWVTDGGMSWKEGLPQSDRGEASQLAMWQYNPAHIPLTPPQINFSSLNYFNDGQGANRADLIGPSPRRLALAMVYNYAIVAGLVDQFLAAVPDAEFPHSQLYRYAAFKA